MELVDTLSHPQNQCRRQKRHTTPTGFRILCDVDITADAKTGKTTGSTVVTRYFVSADGGNPEYMEVTAYATPYERNGKRYHRLHTGGADLDELAIAVRDKDVAKAYLEAATKKAQLLSLDSKLGVMEKEASAAKSGEGQGVKPAEPKILEEKPVLNRQTPDLYRFLDWDWIE